MSETFAQRKEEHFIEQEIILKSIEFSKQV